MRKIVLVLMAAAACSSRPAKPRLVGDAPELGAKLTLTDSVSPPRQVTVEVAQPSSAVLVYVVPGQGASLVYPADTLHSARLEAGPHVVRPEYPRVRNTRAALDSALRRQRDSIARRNPRGTAARAMDPSMSAPAQGFAPPGYLMLVATKASLDPAAVARRIAGVTIPLDEREALSAVGKLVRSTAAVVAPWAGYAVPLTLQARPVDIQEGR